MLSLDIPGRIRGALLGDPNATRPYVDLLIAPNRPLRALAERLAKRWGGIKPDSVYRRLEAFLRDEQPTYSDRLAEILEEVGLTLAPAPREDTDRAG